MLVEDKATQPNRRVGVGVGVGVVGWVEKNGIV